MFSEISRNKKTDFIYNSNLIEEIGFDKKEYKDWDSSSYPEISGHAMATDYMLQNCSTQLSEYTILVMHGMLTRGLVPSKYRGAYRDCMVYIGGHEGLPPVGIKPAMSQLIRHAAVAKTEQDCWNIHHEFEVIHPFIDGNGRTGRLILNWMLLHNKRPFKIIDIKDRFTYYDQIEEYRREQLRRKYE